MSSVLGDGSRKLTGFGRGAGILTLAFCLSGALALSAAAGLAGQDRQRQAPNPPDQEQPDAAVEPQQQPPQPGPPPDAAQQPEAPEPPQEAAPPQEPAPPHENPAPPQAPQREMELPDKLTLPAGTLITVRTSDFLSSDHNHPGELFNAEIFQPVVIDGWVVARRGQTVLGRVAVAQRAGRVKGTSQLGVELSQLVLVDGKQLHVRSQLIQYSGGTTHYRDGATIGTTTVLGTAIGGAAHGGEGAAIGAGAGAAAGIAAVLLTRGRPTIIPPEAQLTFRLQAPVTFSTERSRVAFRPVTPQDYQGGPMQRRSPPRPSRVARGPYPPRPPYPYGPPL